VTVVKLLCSIVACIGVPRLLAVRYRLFPFCGSVDNDADLYSDGPRAGHSEFGSPHGKNFLFTASRPTFRLTQPSIHWLPGIKRPGYEAHLTPPSSVEVKNVGAVPPLHPHVLKA
jgi:hypothetical protein